MLINIIITCTYGLRMTGGYASAGCFLVTVKFTIRKSPANGNNRIPARQFHSLTFLAPLYWYYACGTALAAEGQLTRMTRC